MCCSCVLSLFSPRPCCLCGPCFPATLNLRHDAFASTVFLLLVAHIWDVGVLALVLVVSGLTCVQGLRKWVVWVAWWADLACTWAVVCRTDATLSF